MHVHVVVPAGPRSGSSKGSDFILKISAFNLAFLSRILVNQPGGVLGYIHVFYKSKQLQLRGHVFLDGQHRQVILAPYSAKRFLASSRFMLPTSTIDSAAFVWPWYTYCEVHHIIMPFELSTHIHNWKRSNFDKWSISIYTFRIVLSFGYIKEDCGSVVPSWAQCSGGVPWARPCQHQEDRPWALILWLGLGPTELELGCPPLQPHFHHQTRGCCQSQSHTENPCRNHHSHRFPSFPVLPAHAGANVQCFHHRDCSAYSKTMRYIKNGRSRWLNFYIKLIKT